MKFGTLVRRSLRFHLRSHAGVLLGIAIGGAALTGALLVGDSVRGTLIQNALARLGPAHFAIFSGDRLFLANLSQRLCASSSAGAVPGISGQSKTGPACPLAYGLLLPGTVARQDGAARANQVTVIGVEDPAWAMMAGWGKLLNGIETPEDLRGYPQIEERIRVSSPSATSPIRGWRAGQSAFINQALANQLRVAGGDEILVRVRKPSALGMDAAISPKNETSVSIRLKVGAVLGPELLGDFSLAAAQAAPANLFLPAGILRNQLKLEDRANLVLMGPLQILTPRRSPQPRVDFVDSRKTQALLAERLKSQWLLGDAQLSVRAIEQPQSATGGEYIPSIIEVSSPRIFLDESVATAALRPRRELLNYHSGFEFDSAADVKFSEVVTNGIGILTYLANLIQARELATPYSMVTAATAPFVPQDMKDDEILVNDWLAADLKVKAGDTVRLSYYAADSGSRLIEHTNSFRVRAVVPIQGRYADRTLMPEFPGVAKAESTRDWDAGFPLTYKIREKDEAYWKKYRGTPKAFITLAAGKAMWANRFGSLTAIRYEVPTNSFASTYRDAVARNLLANLPPSSAGLQFEPVRERALKAATEAQDFGQLFLGFSLFLVTAALLLMALLFQFGLEQRIVETGTLLALGFTPRQVRRLFLLEGAILTLPGGLLGVLAGIVYARIMLGGLNTVWKTAVASSRLQFHLTAGTVALGFSSSIVVAVLVIWFTVRKQGKQPARELLAGQLGEPQLDRRSFGKWIALVATGAAVAILIWAFATGQRTNPGAFFGIGCLLLIAGLAFAAAWIGSFAASAKPTMVSLTALGLRSCVRRRSRSVATVALLAGGCFVVSAIGVFRLDASKDANSKSSGTGGFALIGQSTLPIVQDLNSLSGREFFGLGTNELAGVQFVPFRVRPGEEASCLNLNRAQKPRVLGVDPGLLEGRFTFSGAAKGFKLNEGWNMLKGREPSGNDAIPAIGDAASIEWALGKKLGDTLDYTDERGRTFKLVLAGAVANSVLQGNLIIDEAAFVRQFPGESGYRMWLIAAPSNSVARVSAALSRALEDAGLELTATHRKLDEFNAVQNTYLGTFQVLGGLGLLLGSAGLGIVVLRNVMERRGELGLLTAIGFRRRRLQQLLLGEHGALLGLGMLIGMISAAVAVSPQLISPGHPLPFGSLALTLIAVVLNGLIWTWSAMRYSLRGNLVAALRNE